MAKVSLQSIRKSYGALNIIPDLNLEIESGEFVALVGPSGCGKSTILRMVAGLDDPTSGSIRLDGEIINHLSPKDRGIAMVFQNYALYPHMSVRENLGFALKMFKTDAKEIERRILETADILALRELLDRKPAQLSGGQKQRVAMGRAMVRQPKVLLFDEPLSNLDAQLRVKVRAEIALLHKRVKSTILYVTHDQVEAMTLADRIAVLNRGNLEQFGKPLDVYYKPQTKFVAGFVGMPPMNFLPANALANAPKKAATLGFRPENTIFSKIKTENHVELGHGKVNLVEPLGSTTHIHLQVGEQSLVSEVKAQSTLAIGEESSVWIDPKKLFFFDQEGKQVADA